LFKLAEKLRGVAQLWKLLISCLRVSLWYIVCIVHFLVTHYYMEL